MSTPDTDKTARIDSGTPLPRRAAHAEEQYAPGTMVAGRYRIASILGAGGMGEVYRADDTKLGQPVALKFLPARLARDPVVLERLHDEVRLGRQIAHPNVCRIYDIVDWEGAHFVSMEYVDGEDLSRLLHRIGRLAHDKAVEIARGIAAGLAAAHAKGILHRDLKPANVMIDSHGEARIMDFGLALAAEDDSQSNVVAGTPAYMAPEQLAGEPATIQSDLYALGLVMYELFTGKRAHNARTVPERMRDMTSDITTPSSFVRDLDPAVERIILRCLSNEPSERPRSAREVILAFPGGDPLAMALAAGETPSPRLIAAAGSEGTLRPSTAATLLGSVIAMMALLAFYAYKGEYLRIIGLNKPPEVQEARAADLLRQFGIPQQQYTASGLEEKIDYLIWLGNDSRGRSLRERLRGGFPAVSFWMREQPTPVFKADLSPRSIVTRNDPPQHDAGSTTIETDPRGRLISLDVVPSPAWATRPLNWNALFAAAGLRPEQFTAAKPQLVPQSYADANVAWSGRHADDGTPIRVEAAAFRGIPVSFRIVGAWDDPASKRDVSFGRTFGLAMMTVIVIAVVVSAFLAWRNLRQRRGDRAGATRVAAVIFVLSFASRIGFAEHELSVLHEMRVISAALAFALLWAAMFFLVYIALEPYLRRRWPDRLISWARLVGGQWRDPMVGRDVLIGIVAGLGHTACAASSAVVTGLIRRSEWAPFSGIISLLAHLRLAFAHILFGIEDGIIFGMTFMVLLLMFTAVLRRRSFAVAAFFVVMTTLFAFAAGFGIAVLPWYIVIWLIITFVMARYGLLASVVLHVTFSITFFFPQPASMDWYTIRALIPILFVLALSVWAFRTALGGQKLFSMDALDT